MVAWAGMPEGHATAATTPWRLLELAAAPDEPADARVGAFRTFLLLYGATRSWLWVHYTTTGDAGLWLAAVAMSVSAGLALWPRTADASPWLALPAVAFQAAWRFPYTANHLYLELLCLALLVLSGPGRGLALQALRWLTVLVLFHTGLQKLLYGAYLHGDFLAFMVGSQERFADAFRWILPEGEVLRLEGIDRKAAGAGPYRVDHAGFVLASRLVVVAELLLPILLIAQRTRLLAALAATLLMVSIQAGALEIGFALLFTNLLLLFVPAPWNARLLPFFALVLLWALGAALGWLPGDPTRWNLL